MAHDFVIILEKGSGKVVDTVPYFIMSRPMLNLFKSVTGRSGHTLGKHDDAYGLEDWTPEHPDPDCTELDDNYLKDCLLMIEDTMGKDYFEVRVDIDGYAWSARFDKPHESLFNCLLDKSKVLENWREL